VGAIVRRTGERLSPYFSIFLTQHLFGDTAPPT
jgi:hypothetical protein